MDHQDALKGFRSGSTMSSVLPRMSLIDSLNEVHDSMTRNEPQEQQQEGAIDNNLGLSLSATDIKYIFRVAGLVLRLGGLSSEPDEMPYNVYAKTKTPLPESILDEQTTEVGCYLIQRDCSCSPLWLQ